MGNIEDEHLTIKQLVSGGEQKVAGTVGRWSFFQAKTNVALGGYYNASKSYMDLDATGSVTGLMSAHCMELVTPTTPTVGGHYTVGEFELHCGASTTIGPNYSMAWFQIGGDPTVATDMNLKGFLFELTGFAVGNGNIFSNGTPSTFTHALRINVDDEDYFIPLAATYNA